MPAFRKQKYVVIQQKISRAENAIRDCYKEVEILEAELGKDKVPPERQESIRKDLIEIKKILAKNEKKLKKLKKMETPYTTSFAAVTEFCLMCCIIYAVYVLTLGFYY